MSECDYVQDLVELFKKDVSENEEFGTEAVGLLMAASCQERKTSLRDDGLDYFPHGQGRPWQWPDESFMGSECYPWRNIDFAEEEWFLSSATHGRWQIVRVKEDGISVTFFGLDRKNKECALAILPLAHLRVWFNRQHNISRILDASTISKGSFGPSAANWATMIPGGTKAGWGPGHAPLWFEIMSYYAVFVNNKGKKPRMAQTVGI
jgi:hypothetical protein